MAQGESAVTARAREARPARCLADSCRGAFLCVVEPACAAAGHRPRPRLFHGTQAFKVAQEKLEKNMIIVTTEE